MKIAFFCERFPLVSEAFIASSAAALIDRGHELSIFALSGKGPNDVERQPQVLSHQLEHSLRSPAIVGGFADRVMGAPKETAGLLLKRGPSALNVFNPFVFRRSALNLKALYLAGMLTLPSNYDVLHCQFGHLAHCILRLRKAGFLTGRVVVHFRGYDITRIPALAGPNFYDPVFAEADWFIANSDVFRRRALDLGAPRDRIDVSYSGIELSNFPFRPPHSWQPGTPLRLMTTGRLVEKKGIRYAVEAAARLKQDGLDLQYDIVGEGPERFALESLAQSHGLGTRITFHGAKAHNVIQPMLANAHLFIAPSVTASDSNADAPINTLKEAMATGVPVISTVSGGIPELVDDGESGFLAPERDADGLYRRMSDALNASASWPAMTERARATVNNRFDLSRTTDSLIRIYERALAS